MPSPQAQKPEDLLYASVKGDRKSQELLYKQYYGFAMGACLRYIQNKEDALEVVNDSFMKVFTKGEQYSPNFPFKAWFKRIIVNTALDFHRSNQKYYYHEDIEAAYDVSATNESGLTNLGYEELLALVECLPTGYRVVFNLYVIDGFTHEEIGQKLNISIGTSKSNLSRAREVLRQMLTNKEKIKIPVEIKTN